MGAVLEQLEQAGLDALEVSRGSNLHVVIIDDPRLWKLDSEEVGPENPRFAKRPETGTRRSCGVMPNCLECLEERAGGRETLINRWGTSEYCISRSPHTWWPSASTSASSSISTLRWVATAGTTSSGRAGAISSGRATGGAGATTTTTGLTATTATVASASVGTHNGLRVNVVAGVEEKCVVARSSRVVPILIALSRALSLASAKTGAVGESH